MMRKLFLVSTLSLVSLVSGQAKTIENDQPVEITGTVTHDFSGKKAIKMEHLYLTSVNGDTVTMNERQWPVKRIEILFVGSYPEQSAPYKATMEALKTGKTVTLNGRFEWQHHWNQLFFEVD
jgi:hypothetical protein